MQTLEFQAEARQLLQLMVHSIYSNKDIFLRELISNASDALDKLRLAVAARTGSRRTPPTCTSSIEADKEARTLTVRDNGIGMTRDEVVDADRHDRQVRHRRAAAPAQGGQGRRRRELIGQFGVGFYSTFMVADKVTLVTRRAGTRPRARAGSPTARARTRSRTSPTRRSGTAVTVHLRPADEEDALFDYTDEWKIREIVKQYSDFIAFPIRMATRRRPATLNSMKALWARPRVGGQATRSTTSSTGTSATTGPTRSRSST